MKLSNIPYNSRYKDIVPFDANRVQVHPYKVDGDREVNKQIQTNDRNTNPKKMT